MVATDTQVCDFGRKAPDFDLPGVDGNRYRLGELRGENGTLVMFICNHCPYVKSVLDRIVRDTRELAEHRIASVAIMSNDPTAYAEDSFDNMVRISREKVFPFPYLLDDTQEVAKAYGAVCTPDFFGYDANLELQYRGRLDESRMQAVPGARRELYDAMAQVARTGKGPADQTPSVGCSIKWKEPG